MRNTHRLALGGLVVGLVGLLLGSSSIGHQFVSPEQVYEAMTSFDPEDTTHLIVHHLRVPRTLLAVLVGCALGVAGAVMQAVTRNPLADPGILGINAGATLSIACLIAWGGVTSVLGYMWAGMLGAGLAAAGVYLLGGARRGTNPVRLVLAGAALSVVLMAATQIVIINSDEAVFDRYRHWMVGSLQGRGWEVLLPVSVLLGAGLLVAWGLSRALDAAALGKDLGVALGLNPVRLLAVASAAVVMLAGGATAAAGPVAFVGLTGPHIARLLVGNAHRLLIPYTMLISAVLVLAADMLGRIVARPGEVSVGIMVALIGGPFFVALVRRRKLVQL
ncbi:FecCD family ABC transporter permease [Nesterenkonia alba]|uniref:FecCD family ABC transporter permease n=1 Tax=Nesterenkonia alba TaxID=515814 RepID=UPI000419BFF5|nr:iron ABC transporter permease [Nesterenkonia alba]